MNYSETFCEAVDTIIAERLKALSYDKTVICTILDIDSIDPTKYYVQEDNGAKYYAYAESTVYKKKNQVYVTIPQSDYNNKKIIAGKYDKTDKNNYVSLSNKVLPLQESYVLSDDKNQGYLMALTANSRTDTVKKEISNFTIPASATHLLVQADFKTLLNKDGYTDGNFGIRLIAYTDNRNYLMEFDSNEMFGDTMNFQFYLTQEKIFDIINIEEQITKIECELFQKKNFIFNNNTSTETIDNLNIFVDNIKITACYLSENTMEETLTLYCTSSTEYSDEQIEEELSRIVKVNWFKFIDGKAVNITEKSQLGQNTLKWFTKSNNDEEWTYLENYDDQFELTINLDLNNYQQIYKINIGLEDEEPLYSSDLIFKRVNKKLNDIRVRLIKKVRESKGTYDSYKDSTKASDYIKECKNILVKYYGFSLDEDGNIPPSSLITEETYKLLKYDNRFSLCFHDTGDKNGINYTYLAPVVKEDSKRPEKNIFIFPFEDTYLDNNSTVLTGAKTIYSENQINCNNKIDIITDSGKDKINGDYYWQIDYLDYQGENRLFYDNNIVCKKQIKTYDTEEQKIVFLNETLKNLFLYNNNSVYELPINDFINKNYDFFKTFYNCSFYLSFNNKSYVKQASLIFVRDNSYQSNLDSLTNKVEYDNYALLKNYIKENINLYLAGNNKEIIPNVELEVNNYDEQNFITINNNSLTFPRKITWSSFNGDLITFFIVSTDGNQTISRTAVYACPIIYDQMEYVEEKQPNWEFSQYGDFSNIYFNLTLKPCGVDTVRDAEYLLKYVRTNKGTTTTTNKYGSEFQVDANNIITAIREYGETEGLLIPEGGYVLSGHNRIGDKLYAVSSVGDKVVWESDTKFYISSPSQSYYIKGYIGENEKNNNNSLTSTFIGTVNDEYGLFSIKDGTIRNKLTADSAYVENMLISSLDGKRPLWQIGNKYLRSNGQYLNYDTGAFVGQIQGSPGSVCYLSEWGCRNGFGHDNLKNAAGNEISGSDYWPHDRTNTSERPICFVYLKNNLVIYAPDGGYPGRTKIFIQDGRIDNCELNYCTGTVTSSSDERLKYNIKYFDDKYDLFFDSLKPRQFNWKENGLGSSGFIAQEVQESLNNFEIKIDDLVVKTNDYFSLNYIEFIPINTWQIQKLKNRVTELEKEVQELKLFIKEKMEL